VDATVFASRVYAHVHVAAKSAAARCQLAAGVGPGHSVGLLLTGSVAIFWAAQCRGRRLGALLTALVVA
jgi:hypothetical protein